MHPDAPSLAALIGSRICHDLINPIGAISNGLELVAMGTPDPAGPEMSLIQQSCDNATARIRFFRIAFGSAGDTRDMPAAEAEKTLIDHYTGTRIVPRWQASQPLARNLVQLGFLQVLCLEAAVPQGGIISVTVAENALIATATGDTVVIDDALWARLDNKPPASPEPLRPAHVQFALLAQLCADAGIAPVLTREDQTARLSLALPTLGA
ncbi:histidine phosphotransferase family protein [Marivita sp. S2033]|uniref:histidine phosphotransferase family protein n=1 Tax=Marivita sp. S2033 TaxID=3373187 RepID=UPI003982C008